MTTNTNTLAEALREAAQSLETIARNAGKALDTDGQENYLRHFDQVRGYANSRATVARAALEAQAEAKPAEPQQADMTNIESPHNACQHREHCKGWKAQAEAKPAGPVEVAKRIHYMRRDFDLSTVERKNFWARECRDLVEALLSAVAAGPAAPTQPVPIPENYTEEMGEAYTTGFFDGLEHAKHTDLLGRLIAHGAATRSEADGSDPRITCTHEQAARAILDVTGLDVEWAAPAAPAPHADTKDAERYRWLKQQFRVMSLNMGGQHTWVMASSGSLRGPDMDAAVDTGISRSASNAASHAAIAASKGGADA